MSRQLRIGLFVAAGLCLLLFPMTVADPFLLHLGILALLFGIVACNWDLTLGYAGIFNMAHPAFFAMGGYAAGVVCVELEWSPWLGLLVAMAAATVCAVIAYLPILRLRGIYVALITFAFSQLCLNLILSRTSLTGGRDGLVGIPAFTFGDYRFAENFGMAYYYLAAVVLVASVVLVRVFVRSNLGLSVVALRDAEEYAVSRGMNASVQRLKVFVLSAPLTGAAGAIYGAYLQVVSPEVFDLEFAALLLSMVLVGGVATGYGPVIGAIILTAFSENITEWGPWRFVAVGALIVVVMRFFPAGIWGWGVERAADRRERRENRGPRVELTAEESSA